MSLLVTPPTATPVRSLIAVFVGGMVGTGLRLLIDMVIPSAGFPLGTLLINISGSFLLGVLVALVWPRPGLPAWFKVGAGVGVIGSFTTFSAVVVAVVDAAAQGERALAVTYLLASLALSFAAAALGLRFRHGTRTPV
ncbi:MAG: hypothetical protein JWP30_588 [Homoserinimonas sp.]|jgi:CrcB protein|nr:hypothetical protein [Homoserinimonas sp.]